MLIQLACLASLLCPQGQTAGTEPVSLITAGRAYPPRTLVVFSLDRLAPHLAEIRRTGLYRVLSKIPLPKKMQNAVLAALPEIEADTGLTRDKLQRALQGGFSAGLTGLKADGTPSWLFLLPLRDDGPAWQRAMKRLGEKALTKGASFEQIDGYDIWTLRGPGRPPVAISVSLDHLIFADTPDAVAGALRRLAGDDKSTLLDQPGFLDFAASLRADDTPVVAAFARLEPLVEAGLRSLPPAERADARRFTDALHLDRLSGLGFTLQARDGEIHETIRIGFPEPRKGILAALLGTGRKIDVAAARLIPPGVSSFTVAHVSLRRIFDEAVALAGKINPMAPAMLRQMLQAMKTRTGVDLDTDVLGAFRDRMLVLQWPPAKGEMGKLALVFEIDTEKSLDLSLARIFKAMRMPLRTSTIQGVTVKTLPMALGGTRPSFALAQGHLVVADSEASMQATLSTLHNQEGNETARRLFGELGHGATFSSWSDIGAFTQMLAGVPFDQQVPPPFAAALRSAQQELGRITGSYKTSLVLDVGGVTLHGSSPIGSFTAVAVIGIVAAIAIPSLLDSRRRAARAARRSPFTMPARPQPGAGVPSGDRALYESILAAEKHPGPRARHVILAGLDSHRTEVLQRAAFAAGKLRERHAIPKLCKLAAEHAEPELQRYVLAALSEMPDPQARDVALEALESPDAKVRICAARILGKLNSKNSVEPLTELLLATSDPAGPDRVAAILALTDIGDPQSLLTAAAGVEADGKPVDRALAYMFQTLSPKLSPADEGKTLMAVLDHKSLLVRRYAIQRLGQLQDPSTARALEGRLAKEDDRLRPLVQVSLNAVRGRSETSNVKDSRIERLKEKAVALVAKAKQTWEDLDRKQRGIVVGSGVGLMLLLAFLLILRDRRRRQLAAAWAPETEFQEEVFEGDMMEGDMPDERHAIEEHDVPEEDWPVAASAAEASEFGFEDDVVAVTDEEPSPFDEPDRI